MGYNPKANFVKFVSSISVHDTPINNTVPSNDSDETWWFPDISKVLYVLVYIYSYVANDNILSSFISLNLLKCKVDTTQLSQYNIS